MNDRQLDELLQQQLDALDSDIAPSKDLYTGIDHAINSTNPYYKKSLVLAASVVLAIGIAFSGGVLFQNTQSDAPELVEFITLLQADHATNKQSLLVAYEDRAALAPGWEEQMEQLEQAEEVIYQALKADPVNLELLKILRNVQAQQIKLIDAVFAPKFTII